MRAILIDTSGSADPEVFDRIRNEINVGDFVAMFDTKVYILGMMRSRRDIDGFKIIGGGGTLIAPALESARNHGYEDIVVYSDGMFADQSDILYTLKMV